MKLRITPACAGNSRCPFQLTSQGRDHPRLRGEQIASPLKVAEEMGSPPLARGTVQGAFEKSCRKGITPACAGNRSRSAVSCRALWDHPRLRGEQIVDITAESSDQGSPPLARGTEGCA